MLHDAVHILFGVWGLVAASNLAGALLYAREVAMIYALLNVLGVIPATNTAFGLVPIYGHDLWLHGVLAVVAAYFGLIRKESDRSGGGLNRKEEKNRVDLSPEASALQASPLAALSGSRQ